MANFVIRTSNHEEWLEARKGGIGASEIGTILGVNPYDTPYQLWLRKTGRAPAIQENFLMKAGHYLEDAIAQFCADETGVQIVKNSANEFLVVNKDKPHLRVSPDRYAWLPNCRHTKDNKVIIECKSTQKFISEDNIPLPWFVQVMYQLGVCEMDQAYLAWLSQGRDFGYKQIRFDKDLFNDVIVAEIDKFWKDNILGDQEPALISVDDVKIKYPIHSAGKSIDASEELQETCNQLLDVNAQIKELDKKKTEFEDALKFAMADSESIISPSSGKVLATWKASKSSLKFDEKTFAAENPELYKKYLNETQGSRRFSCKL